MINLLDTDGISYSDILKLHLQSLFQLKFLILAQNMAFHFRNNFLNCTLISFKTVLFFVKMFPLILFLCFLFHFVSRHFFSSGSKNKLRQASNVINHQKNVDKSRMFVFSFIIYFIIKKDTKEM